MKSQLVQLFFCQVGTIPPEKSVRTFQIMYLEQRVSIYAVQLHIQIVADALLIHGTSSMFLSCPPESVHFFLWCCGYGVLLFIAQYLLHNGIGNSFCVAIGIVNHVIAILFYGNKSKLH